MEKEWRLDVCIIHNQLFCIRSRQGSFSRCPSLFCFYCCWRFIRVINVAIWSVSGFACLILKITEFRPAIWCRRSVLMQRIFLSNMEIFRFPGKKLFDWLPGWSCKVLRVCPATLIKKPHDPRAVESVFPVLPVYQITRPLSGPVIFPMMA